MSWRTRALPQPPLGKLRTICHVIVLIGSRAKPRYSSQVVRTSTRYYLILPLSHWLTSPHKDTVSPAFTVKGIPKSWSDGVACNSQFNSRQVAAGFTAGACANLGSWADSHCQLTVSFMSKALELATQAHIHPEPREVSAILTAFVCFQHNKEVNPAHVGHHHAADGTAIPVASSKPAH